MTNIAWRGFFKCLVLAAVTLNLVTAQATAQDVRTERLEGEVLEVSGGDLAVRMANGELRHFSISPDREFSIDGQNVKVRDLEPGTKLTADITTTTTPVTETTPNGRIEGTVWFASGPSVILTLPNGENRQYTIKDQDNVKFFISGKEATVFDLRKGMKVSAQSMTQRTRSEIARTAVVTGTSPRASARSTPGTEHLEGEVVAVNGDDLVVRMSNNEIRHFTVAPGRTFSIDGRPVAVRDLEPGTTLSADITTSRRDVEQTTAGETIEGTVWFASGPSVIVTLANGKNRQYTVKDEDNVTFLINGQKASVFDLRKGMKVSAQRMTESTTTVISQNAVVTGHAPRRPEPTQLAQARPAPRPAPDPAPSTLASAAAPQARPATSSSTSSSAGAAQGAGSPTLPKTASSLIAWLLLGVGMLISGAGIAVFRPRRSE